MKVMVMNRVSISDDEQNPVKEEVVITVNPEGAERSAPASAEHTLLTAGVEQEGE